MSGQVDFQCAEDAKHSTGTVLCLRFLPVEKQFIGPVIYEHWETDGVDSKVHWEDSKMGGTDAVGCQQRAELPILFFVSVQIANRVASPALASGV